MTLDKLQKPYKGLHWWYRLLTGRKYYFPVMRQDRYFIYWKRTMGEDKSKAGPYVPCHILNVLKGISFSRKRGIKHFITYIKGFTEQYREYKKSH